MVRASRVRWLGGLVLLCGACGGRGPAQPTVTPPPSAASCAGRADCRRQPSRPPIPSPRSSPPPNATTPPASASWPKATSTRPASSSTARCRSCSSRRPAPAPTPGSATTSIASSIASAPRKRSALAEGDGFSEGPSEPAPIDELLAIASTFRHAGAPAAETAADGARRPRARRPRHPDPAERSRPQLHRAVPGPAARRTSSRAWIAARSTCR